MDFKLKINFHESVSQSDREKINENCRKGECNVKITTNKLNVEFDKNNPWVIKAIKDLKLIYKLEKGCLLLLGNMGCTFTIGYKGEFFVRKLVIEENTDFDSINGSQARIEFNSLQADSNVIMHGKLEELRKDPNLVYNIEQFDEFMKLFKFYKSLSNELNNNMSFYISYCSQEYCFIPVDVKNINTEGFEEVYNNDDILIGYKFEEYKYDQLDSDTKECTKFLMDVEIKCNKDELKNIKRVGLDNIYLSDYKKINDYNMADCEQFQITNYKFKKGVLTLSGELKNGREEYLFLNLYDMGQKIKIESIENSLKLINQGATGAASELLRYIIGDDPIPNDRSRTNAKKEKYMEGLNENQRKAFLMATDGSPISLIKGPPGTGKTHVINAIVQYVTKELDEKVIISSQTHIAIDNVLDKLMSNHDIIIPNRITNRKNKYSDDEIDKTLYKTWASNFESHNKRSSNKTLAKAISNAMNMFNGEKKFVYSTNINKSDYKVIGATTTTSAIAGKKGIEVLKGYDWLIIDEVSKCPITEVLRYLPYVKRIIMVGDDYQLAPLLEFNKDDVSDLKSYDEDMFEKLKAMYENSVFAKTLEKAKSSNRLVVLNENYRSVREVLQLYNVFYNNELIGKREIVKPEKVQVNSDILSKDKDIFFVEVKNGKEAIDGTSRYNIEEINATTEILKDLIKNTVNPETVTIAAIFPYAAQISRFQKGNQKLINEAKQKFKSFEIDTVDAFQGKEADIVLCNTVVADSTKKNFLNDFRRINVSLSRAKDKLIIFGNSIVLSKIEMGVNENRTEKYFKDIIEYIVYENHGQAITYEGGIKYETSRKSSVESA